MTILEFVAVCLAAGALVDAWLHEPGLFDEVREWISVWGQPRPDEVRETGLTWRAWGRGKIAQLAGCHKCMTYHAAFWLLLLFWLPSHWLNPPWTQILFFPIWALAATRFSLLMADLHDRLTEFSSQEQNERQEEIQ